MDPLAFRYANALVGNGDGEAGLEFAIVGPTLRFHANTTVRVSVPMMRWGVGVKVGFGGW